VVKKLHNMGKGGKKIPSKRGDQKQKQPKKKKTKFQKKLLKEATQIQVPRMKREKKTGGGGGGRLTKPRGPNMV